MKFSIKPTDPAKLETDVLIMFCHEDELNKLPLLNKKLTDLIKAAAAKEGFEGRKEQFFVLQTKEYIGAYKLLIAGVGKSEESDLYRVRKYVAEAVKKASHFQPEQIAFVLPDAWLEKFTTESIIQATVEAGVLSSYKFFKYKSSEEKSKIKEIKEAVLCITAGRLASAEKGVKLGLLYSEATCFARDLINEPSTVTTPSYLATLAQAISKESKGKVKATILERAEIKKLGMNAYLGVAKGSDELPKLIRLDYKPRYSRKKIAIIGKGITFDTGGLSLKSSEQMEKMKMDMAGAAAVLAIFKVLPFLNIEASVVGLIPACENMVSSRALKPGDIVTAVNGKTIEVLNTDAEGRLTLADALFYLATKEKPDYLIDLATLTGSCIIALGEEIAGLWSTDRKLLEKLQKASDNCGEKLWQMPLFEEYKPLIKSDIADLKNTQTGKYAGSITAALFLSEFTAFVPWAHLDIAGPSFAEKDSALMPKGGAGFGVRLLLSFLGSI